MAIFLITMIGFLTANFIGRAIVNYGEYLLSRMPFVRSIYSTLKQIFETVLSNKADMFSKVGIVEYPRKGVWSIVFIASEKDSEINSKLNDGDDPTVAVFMPCTPNPTTGFLMYVPKSDIIELSMSVEDARQGGDLGRAGHAGIRAGAKGKAARRSPVPDGRPRMPRAAARSAGAQQAAPPRRGRKDRAAA